jgi:hypothetical protein
MRVLIGFECSGIERDAFLALGHDAMSCDLKATQRPGPHYQGDIRDVLHDGWAELAILHPECTYLTNSANGSLDKLTPSANGKLTGPARWKALIDNAVFFRQLLDAPVERLAIENPVMNGYAKKIIGRPQDQIVQPWMFGQPEYKQLCLWLKNLPPLIATEDVRAVADSLPYKESHRIHSAGPSDDRSEQRSESFPSIAEAMANQWGGDVREAVA